MPLVVGVSFPDEASICYLEVPDGNLRKGMLVVAQSAHGLLIGKIVVPPKHWEPGQQSRPRPQILRLATSQDIAQWEKNQDLEREILDYAVERIAALDLPMKVIRVRVSLDRHQTTLYFSAPKRVDFRRLVRELTARFPMRIRLTQVGERDEARLQGGLGPCGRSLCCAGFMRDYAGVSIRTAKLQDLPLSTGRLAGLCGKLKCCLNYEKDLYEEALAQMPEMGACVSCPYGQGKVVGRNVFQQTVTVALEGGESKVEVPARSCQTFRRRRR